MRLRLGTVAALLGTLACSGSASGGLPSLLLPDLDQRPPLAVSVRWGGPPKHPPLLVFTSSVENVGYGPLLVEGRRASRRVSTMRANQLIALAKGGYRRVPGVGRLRYNVNPSHSHWHLLPFERYELRTLAGAQIVRDHKSGFCLTSDHRSPLPTLGPPGTQPIKGSDCASDRPRALRRPRGNRRRLGRHLHPREGGAGDRHQRRRSRRLRPRPPRQRRSAPARSGLLRTMRPRCGSGCLRRRRPASCPAWWCSTPAKPGFTARRQHGRRQANQLKSERMFALIQGCSSHSMPRPACRTTRGAGPAGGRRGRPGAVRDAVGLRGPRALAARTRSRGRQPASRWLGSTVALAGARRPPARGGELRRLRPRDDRPLGRREPDLRDRRRARARARARRRRSSRSSTPASRCPSRSRA